MAFSKSLRPRDAIGVGACNQIRKFLGHRGSILDACDTARTNQASVAAVVNSLVPLLGDVTLRRAFGLPYVLRPGCLSALSSCRAPAQYFSSPRSGNCRRADVGFRNFCL